MIKVGDKYRYIGETDEYLNLTHGAIHEVECVSVIEEYDEVIVEMEGVDFPVAMQYWEQV